jgi:hypothetical protein
LREISAALAAAGNINERSALFAAMSVRNMLGNDLKTRSGNAR